MLWKGRNKGEELVTIELSDSSRLRIPLSYVEPSFGRSPLEHKIKFHELFSIDGLLELAEYVDLLVSKGEGGERLHRNKIME